MTDQTTLRPCPFCGSTNIHFGTIAERGKWIEQADARIECCEGDCEAGVVGDTDADAVARWNRRSETPQPISHDRAMEAALRLIQGSFRRDGQMLDNESRPRFSIPAQPEHDDDLVLCNYIRQQKKGNADAKS